MRNLSYIEIKTDNLLHNLGEFKKLHKGRIAAVIKGNAYGHGLKQVAQILDEHIDYFQVDDYEEFKTLRSVSKKTALVLGYLQDTELEPVVTQNGIPGVYNVEQINILNDIGKKLNKPIEFHLKVDCLLGRQGFLLDELPKVLAHIKKNKHAKIAGIYTHFSNIEDTSNLTHANAQIDQFKKALALASTAGFHNLETHINATSGLLIQDVLKFNTSIARLGIGLYGMWPSGDLKRRYQNKIHLKPAMRWITHIAQIKNVPKGYPIGYGLTYITPRKLKVIIIPQGYSDGYDRGLSNIGNILVKGKRCSILGRVAMNMFAVDVSRVQSVKRDDEVVLLGTQLFSEISAEEIAKSLNTINYEITTRVSPLLPRIVV